MSEGNSKWSWSRLEQKLSMLTKKKPSRMEAQDEQENPWLSLHAAHERSAVVNEFDTEYGNGIIHNARDSSKPRWLSDGGSPYGFSDDDGTLKQVDGPNWRRMFGGSTSQRFVPSQQAGSRWQASEQGNPRRVRQKGSTWVLQTVSAVVLVVAGVYSQHTSGAIPDKIKNLYHAALTPDYTNVTLPAVQQFLDRHHITVPTFLSNTGSIKLHVPLNGAVTEDYSATHPEMFITGSAGGTVWAAGSGTVTQVAKVGAQSLVVVDHGSLGVTTYSNLSQVSVQKGQSVSAGEGIGTLTDQQPVLHFSMQRGGHYVNPHDYIHFSDSGV